MMAKSLVKRRRRKLIALSLEVLVRNLNGGHNLTILMLTRSGVPNQHLLLHSDQHLCSKLNAAPPNFVFAMHSLPGILSKHG